MKTWILSKYERDDEQCEHDYEVIGAYAMENMTKAINKFYHMCELLIEPGDEISFVHNEKGFYFSTSNFDEHCYDYQVRLELMDIEEPEELKCPTIAEMKNRFFALAE